MYLTHITHDFDFALASQMEEALHSLQFKKTGSVHLLPLFKTKIYFHNNQNRNIHLTLGKKINSSVKSFSFTIEDIVKFFWTEGSGKVEYKYLKQANEKLVHYWLLHTFLPLYYEIENIYDMFHVGAVEIEGKASLFAAPSFGGKSTLTYHFLQKGHTLLCDDTLALTQRKETCMAVPSYPYARNYRAFEDLGEHISDFSKRSLPVGCIYKLLKAEAEDEVVIKEVKGVEKFAVIEMCSDIKLSFLKEKKFSHLHHLTQCLPVYSIKVPQNLHRLDEVYEKITAHFKKSHCSS